MAVQKDILENAGVPAQDVQRLEAAWAAYQGAKNQPVRDIPCIVCTGIYNAGKSTLLNALTGTEHFPTGDVPTTKTVAQAELDGAVYIDTPGLNAAEADDMETQAAYEAADFILFVSSAVSGGISQAEAQWLRTLGERYDLGQRLIFVLTKCGQAAPEELLEPLRSAAPALRPRLTPYHAVGTAAGLLLTIRTDWTEINGTRYPGLTAALAPGPLGGGYAALWGGPAGKGGRHDHASKTETAADPLGAPAAGGNSLHRRQRHPASAADPGAGGGAAGRHG